MIEDYLWDKSGQPDPEVAQLEHVLKELRWTGKRRKRQWSRKQTWALAAAAAIALGLFFPLIHTSHPVTSWQLSLDGQKPSPVRAGQIIETGRTGATMQSEFVGQVDIDRNSRLRMLSARNDQHRLALDHGTIHARIWAPPAKFIVDTPAAKTIDLGCKYTLCVAKDGKGFLTVEMGWVAFQWNKIESFIPEGAACTTRVGHGPDTPYFLDAPKALTGSLAEFDRTGSTEALNSVLQAARPHDALTLWHLLERTSGSERIEVYNRFAGLVKLPPNVTREGILHSDPQTMDAAWNALDFGDTTWWREWKRNW
jgi:hypothetical protein